MGSKTLNDIFYKPDIGASGAVEKGKFDDGLDDADVLIEANKDAKHTQGTDQGLDTGGGNAVVVADIKDSVTKKHTQGTDQGLDTGGGNAVVVADVKDAVTKKHTQNTDTDLDVTFEATFVKKVDKLSVMAATSSAELAGVISDETGTGKAVFGTLPTINKINLSEGNIIFPATQVAAAGVNTLDDYEKGTFDVTADEQTTNEDGGKYIKIGNMVYVEGTITADANGSNSGGLRIECTPFAPGNSSMPMGSIIIQNVNLSATGSGVVNPFNGIQLIIDGCGFVRANSSQSNPYYKYNLLKIGTVVYFSGC